LLYNEPQKLPGWARQGQAGGTTKNYRRKRLIFSSNPNAFIIRPRFRRTNTDFTTPYAWRLFWLRYCLGWLKKDWNKPVRLTRQLRRQLERNGGLVLNEDSRRSLSAGRR
jgi:hypothetical protein